MNAEWISLEEVTFVRRQRVILDHIRWTVQPGHHWVVLGANGSGKTTLLQLLAGYLWPTQGRITVLGERFGQTDLRELRKKIGWVGSFLEAQIPSTQKPLDLIVSGKYASIGIFETPGEEDYRQAKDLAVRLKCQDILELPYGVLSRGKNSDCLSHAPSFTTRSSSSSMNPVQDSIWWLASNSCTPWTIWDGRRTLLR